MENGGQSLTNVSANLIGYQKFLQMLKTFLKGMVLFQKKGFVHNDIKPDNILINKNKISLIDFSLLTDTKGIYSEDTMIVLDYHDYFNAPEYFIYHVINEEGYFDKKEVYDFLMYKDFFKKDHFSKFDSKMFQKQIKEFLAKIFIDKNETVKLFNPKLVLKADVFSFAYILDSILRRHVVKFKYDKDVMFVEKLLQQCQNGNPYKRPSFRVLYNRVCKEYDRLYPDSK